MTHTHTVQDSAVASFRSPGPDGPGAPDRPGAPEGQTAPSQLLSLDEAPESDAGMSTVEYAVGTVVAAAFAAVLYRIVTGDSIVAGLTSLVQSALDTGF